MLPVESWDPALGAAAAAPVAGLALLLVLLARRRGKAPTAVGPSIKCKSLPSDPAQLQLPVRSAGALAEGEVAEMVRLLNEYGAAVLVPQQAEDPLQIYQSLDKLLGKRVPHDREDENGVVVLDARVPTSVNVAQPEREHLPHTDDAYMQVPAEVMTLQCRVPAAEGGLSTLVCGSVLLECTDAAEFQALSKPGMITAGRRPATPDAPWKFTSSLPTFSVERGRSCLRWRCHDACVKFVHDDVRETYARLDRVARDERLHLHLGLEPGQVLVLDNRAHAHGRTTYKEGMNRIMWRKNYMNDGLLKDRVVTGICDKSELQKRGIKLSQLPSASCLLSMASGSG